MQHSQTVVGAKANLCVQHLKTMHLMIQEFLPPPQRNDVPVDDFVFWFRPYWSLCASVSGRT